MMDIDKFKTLSALVREAKEADRKAFDAMEAARAEWKKANEVLTDRVKVLDGYVASAISESTSV